MEISNALHQAMVSHGLSQQQQDKKLRPHQEQALRCPRCASTNTKFCYYNNYSLCQPRYFCKGCRRYWTQGGSLRNVPVGGGCRRNKRSSSSSSSSSKKVRDQDPLLPTTLIPPPLSYDPTSDLSFSFAKLQKQPSMKQFGLDDKSHNFLLGNPSIDPIPSAPAPANGFVDITSLPGFSSLYYGYGVNGSIEMASGVSGEEGGLSLEGGLSGSTSQGSCKAMDGGYINKVPTGLDPWQDGNMDSATRDCSWNGVGSSLQGLINSPLL